MGELYSSIDVDDLELDRRGRGVPIDCDSAVVFFVVGDRLGTFFIIGWCASAMKLIEAARGQIENWIGRLFFFKREFRPVSVSADDHSAIGFGLL